MTLKATAIDHLVLNVRDVEASAAWYVAMLGARRESFDPGEGRPLRTAVFFGDQRINLRPVETNPEVWFTASTPTAGSDDLCFLVDGSPDAVLAHLAALDIPIEKGPIARDGARGRLCSVYCRDPDGNLVELASYGDASA